MATFYHRVDPNADASDAAVALTYDGVRAPVIRAAGEGDLARQIVEIALREGVPTYQQPGLANVLAQLDIGTEVPAPLYHAVAEMIAFAWLLRGETPESADPGLLAPPEAAPPQSD